MSHKWRLTLIYILMLFWIDIELNLPFWKIFVMVAFWVIAERIDRWESNR